MTKTAFLGDIHGYAPALRAAIRWCSEEQVDAIVGLGDFVDGYDADEECVSLVKQHFAACVRGNHDEDHGRQLSHQSAEWLQQLPDTIHYESWQVTHSTPRSNHGDEYLRSSVDAWNCFDDCDFQRCVVGHAHRPMLYRYRSDIGFDSEALDIAGEGQVIEPDERYLLVNPSLAYNRSGQQNPGFTVFDSQSKRLRSVYLDLPQMTAYS